MNLERASTPADPGPLTLRGTALVAGLCAVGAAVVFWRYHALRHDDAFITFQFARNLATGNGFVFNPGERVLGTTSPLHALILACAYFLFGEALPTVAVGLGALGVGAQAFFLFLLLRRTSPVVGAVVALLVLAGFADGFSFLALETQLFAAAVVGAVWAVSERRGALCGALLGVAFLLRYDAALLVPVVAISWWLRWKKLPRAVLTTSFAVVAPWLLWATFYFGSFLPQTFFAKQRITPPLPYLQHYAEFISGTPSRVLSNGGTSVVLAVAAAVVAVAGVVFALRRVRPLLPLFAFCALLMLAYAWMGPHFLQHWHLYPATLAFQVAFVAGLVGWLGELSRRLEGKRRAAVAGAMVALSCALLAGTAISQLARSRAIVSSFWLGERNARYEQISAWLRENVDPRASFLALEVGTLGYDSQLRMIDPYGLINDTNSYPRVPTLESLLELMDRYRPDVLLVNTPEQGAAIEQRTPFRMVKVFGSDPWSTLLVVRPEVLGDAGAFDRLRRELPERARR